MSDRLKSDANLRRLVQILKRRWWIVVLIAAIAAAGAYGFAKHQPKKYSATGALLFQDSNLDQLIVGNQVISSNPDPTREAATNQALVELPSVAALVGQQLGISSHRVESEVSFGSDSQSDVFPVTVTDRSPRMAARIANAYIQQYILFRRRADQSQLAQAEQLVKAQVAQIPPSQANSSLAQSLKSRSYELSLVGSLQTGDAEPVQTATPPKSPSSPVPLADALIGLALGLIIGGILVFVLERFDRRIKTSEEVEELLGVPIIGMIPESQSLRQAPAAGTLREQEAFRMVRAQLRYFDVDRDIRRVLITSADSGEGKSTLSLNLARAAASGDDRRILLVEAEMRRPSVSRMIGLDPLAGLAELLSHSQDLASGLRELVVSAKGPDDESIPARVDVLVAGAPPPNPLELLESQRMSDLLEVADSLYDLVIIDTPPIGVVSDAIALVHQVDGVVVVTRIGHTRRDHATSVIKQLRRLRAHLLGVVVNGTRSGQEDYYGYENYAPRETGSAGRRNGRKGRHLTTRGR